MKIFQNLVLAAVSLTLCVIVFGAYVRLSHAGLGCPDWPGCYGHLGVPQTEQQIAAAERAYPQRPVEVSKGWKEMTHRYLASLLGLIVIGLAALAWKRRRTDPAQPLVLPLLLLPMIGFQSLLGMWTVTWQLKPLVVTAHLLGGMTTLALLWWLFLQTRQHTSKPAPKLDTAAPSKPASFTKLRPWAFIGLLLLTGQIALGGWTSTNYAALACTEFPTCQGRWWPDADFSEAFVLWRGLGVNYEFGVLDHPARVAVHMAHRLGAVLVLLYIGALAAWAIRRPDARLRALGGMIAVVLLAQIALGISNVWWSLPLPVAVAHNGVAALLLLLLLTLNHRLLKPIAHRKNHDHRDTTIQPTSAMA